MKRIGSAVMRNGQFITRALGFAAAVLTAGSALGGADHGHGGHEDAAAVAPPPAVVAPATQPAAVAHEAPAPAPANRDNLPLLGGMLLVSGLVSWGISHLIRARSGNAVAPAIVAPSETPNAAAAAAAPVSSA
jgi:hypothetical protein